MTATITKLATPSSRQQPKQKSSNKNNLRIRQQALAGTAICTVALTLTGLSLTHLSHGIEIVTHAPAWECWAMALGIDTGFVALEVANMAAATDKTRKLIGRWTVPAILGTLAASAGLNALAFAWQADGWMQLPAAALGIAIPALVYALTRVGASMWLEQRKDS